jgi:hypothetical protein
MLNVAALTGFVAAAQQQDKHLASLQLVNAIAGAVVDP